MEQKHPEATDVVYTWVNGSDPQWQRLYANAMANRNKSPREHASANDWARFDSRDELYYSVQSVRKYAPWVRNIYVVTNCSLPDWTNSEVCLFRVPHEDLFKSHDDLPTFNAFAIETVLHRINGLSENFIYFNDDVFLCADTHPSRFFTSQDHVRPVFSKHAIPYQYDFSDLRPVDTGAINSASLLVNSFGYQPVEKLQHAPHPLKKSILQEIEETYPDEISATRSQAFRHPDDIAMATTLHAYYAQYTGRAKPSDIKTRYIDIGDWQFLGLVHPWSPLMRGKYTTLCLNEVTSIRFLPRLRDWIVRWVMRRLFA